MSTRGIQRMCHGAPLHARIRPDWAGAAALGLCVHFLRAERHDRFRGGHEPGWKVTPSFGAACYSQPRWTRCGTEDAVPPLTVSGRRRRVELGALLAERRKRLRRTDSYAWERLGSVANRSVLHPTRLETRTKESNMWASHGVLRNPKAQ